jgi:hypothetical protein
MTTRRRWGQELTHLEAMTRRCAPAASPPAHQASWAGTNFIASPAVGHIYLNTCLYKGGLWPEAAMHRLARAVKVLLHGRASRWQGHPPSPPSVPCGAPPPRAPTVAAVALAGGGRPVVEDVAHVALALGAAVLCARHEENGEVKRLLKGAWRGERRWS